MPKKDRAYLTKEQAAKKLRVSVSTIDRLIRNGALHKYHIQHPLHRTDKRIYVLRKEVNQLLANPPAMASDD